MTISEIRTHFPFLETGKIYLNHAAVSPLSDYVTGEITTYLEGRSAGKVGMFEEMLEATRDLRSLMAEFLSTRPDRVGFGRNTSEALSLVASGLPWRSGDTVLLNDAEFPANVYPWLNQRRHGVEVKFLPTVNGAVTPQMIEDALTPKTRVVALSFVQFLSGYRADLAAIGTLCREKGVLLIVDGIQGLGPLRIDLSNTPVDFIGAGVQKWLMGPLGIAVFYITEELQERLQPAYAGWLSVRSPFDFFNYSQELRDTAARFEYGTPAALGLFGFRGALRFFRDVGFDNIGKMVKDNADRLFSRLDKCELDIITPRDEHRRAGIVTFSHPRAEEIFHQLQERDIIVSHRSGHLRLAPHFYNTPDEIDRACVVIEELTTS